MATQTIVLAASVNAGDSADIVVGSTPVTIVLFASDGVVSYGVQCPVTRKVNSVYQPAPDERGPVFLSAALLEITIYAPGTYRVSKAITAEAMGFYKDEV